MKYNISQSTGNIRYLKNKAIYDLQTLSLQRKKTSLKQISVLLFVILYIDYVNE